ncbi:cell cycle control protein 50A-like [Anopheles cruzii]|uniref:cell cycle control protein 50A-like n=1 Tax=Anopheles cruzii TaxID=68878 RepID=UPI0022EC21C1|nr:cell cycle control protein 50A-like [Anopheles cruzii]
MADVRVSQETKNSIAVLRPPNTAFHQQRLATWEPAWTPKAIWPILMAVATVFLSIGLALLYVSYNTPEQVLDYTDCQSTEDPSRRSCAEIIDHNPGTVCSCSIIFTLDRAFPPPVYLYYALTNFYQNHRQYTLSRDDGQLQGVLSKTPSERCRPFDFAKHGDELRPILPCGALANSLFNDSFTLTVLASPELRTPVPLVGGGALWPHERGLKFRNPKGDLRLLLSKYARPPAWSRELWELDPANPDNNGLQNEDFIVWMQPAALPNFRKLFRKVAHLGTTFERGLPSGNYTLRINYSYTVKSFFGRKSVIISSSSVLGARNPFLGWAFITVAIACLIFACLLYAF